jgi:hypothetical protein
MVSDPRSALFFLVIGPCFYSKLFVNVKSDIALSKSLHPLVEGAVVRGRVQ